MGVARASLEELLIDFQDFLCQKDLPLWGKDYPKAKKVRGLCYSKNRSDSIYETYYEASSETAANALVCLIHQTNYLLDQQLRALEKEFLKDGGFTKDAIAADPRGAMKKKRHELNYTEDDLIMISALAHYSYCPRRCALIHIEQIWDENRATAEGRIMHEKIHEQDRESRGKVRIEYGTPLRSLRLGLVGKADVVEFQPFEKGDWQPFPVEYKRGKPKPDHCDLIQLCAQAICLEEMLSVSISGGAIFYGRTRRRLDVSLEDALRKETEEAAHNAHELIASGITPPPVYEKRCESCSLIGECLPKASGKKGAVKRYFTRMMEEP